MGNRKMWNTACIALLFVLCIAKLFTGTVSFGGDTIYHCMTADYFDFARSMDKGAVLYEDLLDHKGPYIFFLYGLLGKLSNWNVGIVPFAECAVFALTIASFFAALREDDKRLQKAALFFLGYFIVTFRTPLVSVEGMLLPLWWVVYTFVMDKKETKKTHFFLTGAIIGFFFVIKYTVPAYFFPLFVACMMKKCKETKAIRKVIASGIAGFVAVVVPAIVWTAGKHLFSSYWYCMSISGGLPFVYKVLFVGFLLLGVWFLLRYLKNKDERDMVLSTFAFSLMGVIPSSYVIAFLFGILAFCFLKERCRVSVAVDILSFLVAYSIVVVVPCLREDFGETRRVAEELGIEGNDVLYFEEDLGFGLYGERALESSIQVTMMHYWHNDEFMGRYKKEVLEALQEKKFSFVVVFPDVQNIALRPMIKLQNEVFPALQENYEEAKEYNGYVIWRKK